MQGPHQVAQKSSTTTLPESEARLTLPEPARSGSSNAGAGPIAFSADGAWVQPARAPATSATVARLHIPGLYVPERPPGRSKRPLLHALEQKVVAGLPP